MDTISAIRAGFKPIWSTEICNHRREMWADLTDCPSLGDTFAVNYDELNAPDYLTSGQPCPDYSRSGSHLGMDGETGWMFTEQTKVILRVKPKIFRLEITDYALDVHSGLEVKSVCEDLSHMYHVQQQLIPVWKYGDPTARVRLFIIGVRLDIKDLRGEYTFPNYTTQAGECLTLREIAQSDDEVPQEYWRTDEVGRYKWYPPSRCILHKIGQAAVGMGHARLPNAVYSWESLGNSQTTHNGGGRRPRYDWVMTEEGPIGDTRLMVPIETVRAASLMEDYMEWCSTFKQGDEFLRECVNNGVPCMTCYSIDKSIMEYLTDGSFVASLARSSTKPRTAMLDTGANLHLMHRDVEPELQAAKRSRYNIQVANKQYLKGSVDGTMTMLVLNSMDQQGMPLQTTLTQKVTTVDHLSRELFSVEDLYSAGYSILLRNDNYQGGIKEIYKPASQAGLEVRIPVRHDALNGGFWIDYELGQTHGCNLLRHCYSVEKGNQIVNKAIEHPDIEEIILQEGTEQHNILGVKQGLRPAKNKMSRQDFHAEFGHLGSVPGCEICRLARGAMRRIGSKYTKYKEVRRAHTWVMDTVTWSDRDNDGSKYMTVMRCKATGAFKNFYQYSKDDIRVDISEWINRIRTDPAYSSMGYAAVSLIETDLAGEWGLKCKEWNELENKLGFRTNYSPPDRKESSGTAERACGIMEVVTKSILMQQNLPPQWWVRAAKQAEWLLNRFPTVSATAPELLPPDGDQARPLEIISGGCYSRRQIDRELSYYIPLGTPALVHDVKAKGSQLGPKSMWGVAVGMYRESILFWIPHTDSIRQTKSFTAFKLRQGLNYAQFLNLPAIPTTQRSAAIAQDFDEVVTVKLPQMKHLVPDMGPPIQQVKSTIENFTVGIPEVRVRKPNNNELKGTVTVLSHGNEVLYPNTDTGCLEAEQARDTEGMTDVQNKAELSIQQPNLRADNLPRQKSRVSTRLEGSDQVGQCYVNIEIAQKLWDDYDMLQHSKSAIVTRPTDTFKGICKQHGIPCEYQELYKQWLIQNIAKPSGGPLNNSHLPTGRGTRLPAQLRLPQPCGSVWYKMTRQGLTRENEGDDLIAVKSVEQQINEEIRSQNEAFRATGRFTMAASRKPKKKRISKTGEPNSTREALEHPDRAQQWAESMDEEIDGLTKMGVLDHNYTQLDLDRIGIVTKPVPLGLYHTHKKDNTGVIKRLKTRAAVRGHPGNMTKGVHYFDTFAPTPGEDSVRVLCCLVILMNLTRKCCDIVKAYCWADAPAGSLIALSYPDGYQRRTPEGDELFMVMRKNLYGHPAAARTWTEERDRRLLRHLNENGWTCKQTRMDPCMFVMTDNRGKRAYMIIHTDDCDAAGEDETILDNLFKLLHHIWEIKVIEPDFMLGINRKLTMSNSRVDSIECTMTAFVEAMVTAFAGHVKEGSASTPVPDKVVISKLDAVTDEEIREVLKLGYQRAVGMLLWAARFCFPQCKYGVSRLCSVMSKPTHKAFKAAMHMIRYMELNKYTGIKFSLSGNHEPMGLSDASNKPDPADGLAQGGFAIMWMGGPISTQSKKLKHVGLSSEHNEYMELTFAAKRVVWLRQLLEELGVCHEALAVPTLLLGDNIQANRLCREHFISTGNQYVYLSYHFIKETVELGMVDVKWLSTKLNTSDLMTKPVPRQTLLNLVGALTGYEGPVSLAGIIREAQ